MHVKFRKERIECSNCSGFGEFDREDNAWKPIKCSKCGSIHAESLGLQYFPNKVMEYFMYVQSESIISFKHLRNCLSTLWGNR